MSYRVGTPCSFILFKYFQIFRNERIPTAVPLTIENMDRLVDKISISLFNKAGLVLSKLLNRHSPLKVMKRQLENVDDQTFHQNHLMNI